MLRILPLLLSAFLWIGLTVPGLAQQQEEQETGNSLLPEIDPQDIEIRSQFQARFPGTRRQPILGFDPTPRVYQIDPSRQPFMETDEEVVTNLPVSDLRRPDAPEYDPPHYSPEINMYARGGFGSYMSPTARFWGVHRMSKNSYFGADLDYSSSDGHLDTQQSSFRFLNATLDFATRIDDNKQLYLTAGGQSDFNHLYENALVTPTAKKNYGGFNLSADLKHVENSVEGWNVKANIRYFRTELNAASLSGDKNETVFRGAFSKKWAGSRINEVFSVHGGIKGGLYGSGQNQQSWSTFKMGAQYNRLLNYSTEITGKANFYYLSNFTEERVYVGPWLTVEHTIKDKLILRVEGGARPHFKTVEQHHEANRFLNVDNQFVHTSSMEARAEGEFKYYKGSTVNAGIQYKKVSNYPFYFRKLVAGGQTTDDHFYSSSFSEATNLRFFAGITHQLNPEKFWISAKIYKQNPELSSGDRIPFEENWGVTSSASARFFDRLTVEGWADYMGSRKTFVTNNTLDGFLLVGIETEVELSDHFGAFIKIVNILDQRYEIWDGYEERGFQIYGGLTIKL